MKSKIKYFLRHPLSFFITKILRLFPYFQFLYKTDDYQGKVSLGFWFNQKVLNIGKNREAYWPVHRTSDVVFPEKILVGVDAYPGIMGGCYIQGRGGIYIGDYTQVAPNVIIVSSNHDLYDTREHVDAPVRIGKYCWLAAGCKIMPGVVLGDHTIVGAGAVVTKSFPEGYCLIGGNPAKLLKVLEKKDFVEYSPKEKFRGYIKEEKFLDFRRKNLSI